MSVIQCAINSGFRSISVSVTDFTDVAGATNEFENGHRFRSEGRSERVRDQSARPRTRP